MSLAQLTPAVILQGGRDAVVQGLRISLDLFKIMVPILVAVKILQELDLIRHLAAPLSPLMELVGLPGVYGLVWAAALLNSLYAGLIVVASLVGEHPLTTAQMTILAAMLLVAHNMPLELAIARRSGARLVFQLLLRFGGALLLGMLLHWSYRTFGGLDAPARLLFAPPSGPQTLVDWALGQLRNLLYIGGIVICLVALMRALAFLGVTRFMDTVLAPFLRFMGISRSASAITVVGMTMGIAYGGGLIIAEARSGRVAPQDVFGSVSLMGLSHALIEDSLLMVLIGAHLSGVLWARLVFSLLLTAMIMRVALLLPEDVAGRYLWTRPAVEPVA